MNFRLDELRSNNATADIIGYRLDRDGELPDIEVNHRAVGICQEALRDIPNVILTVTGINRIRAIRAVLRGKHCNTRLTDRTTAEALLPVA